MKRRAFLKLLGITTIGLAVNPVSTFKSTLDIGIRNTWTDSYAEVKRRALEQHAIEMEKAFLYGIGPKFKPIIPTRRGSNW